MLQYFQEGRKSKEKPVKLRLLDHPSYLKVTPDLLLSRYFTFFSVKELRTTDYTPLCLKITFSDSEVLNGQRRDKDVTLDSIGLIMSQQVHKIQESL